MLINSNDRKSYEGGGHIMQIIEVNNENMGGYYLIIGMRLGKAYPIFITQHINHLKILNI